MKWEIEYVADGVTLVVHLVQPFAYGAEEFVRELPGVDFLYRRDNYSIVVKPDRAFSRMKVADNIAEMLSDEDALFWMS